MLPTQQARDTVARPSPLLLIDARGQCAHPPAEQRESVYLLFSSALFIFFFSARTFISSLFRIDSIINIPYYYCAYITSRYFQFFIVSFVLPVNVYNRIRRAFHVSEFLEFVATRQLCYVMFTTYFVFRTKKISSSVYIMCIHIRIRTRDRFSFRSCR